MIKYVIYLFKTKRSINFFRTLSWFVILPNVGLNSPRQLLPVQRSLLSSSLLARFTTPAVWTKKLFSPASFSYFLLFIGKKTYLPLEEQQFKNKRNNSTSVCIILIWRKNYSKIIFTWKQNWRNIPFLHVVRPNESWPHVCVLNEFVAFSQPSTSSSSRSPLIPASALGFWTAPAPQHLRGHSQ